jgi:SAM-dependent methyltransferase
MEQDRSRWERRYEQKAADARHPPSRFLQYCLDRLPRGRALELACGDGRNAVLLARHGFIVDAIDIAAAGLRRAADVVRAERLRVQLVQADLDSFPLPVGRYGVVINVRFLQRRLFSAIKRCVQPGGMVVFETFTSEQAQLGHPTNPAYLLEPGELRRAFADFDILVYEEGRFDTETGAAHLARLLARRPTP